MVAMNLSRLNAHNIESIRNALDFVDRKTLSLVNKESRLGWSNDFADESRLCWRLSFGHLVHLAAAIRDPAGLSPTIKSIELQGTGSEAQWDQVEPLENITHCEWQNAKLQDLRAVRQFSRVFPRLTHLRLVGTSELGPNSVADTAQAYPMLESFQIQDQAGLSKQSVLAMLTHCPNLKRLDLTPGLAMVFLNEPGSQPYPCVEVVKLNDDPDVVFLSPQQISNLKSWFPNIRDYSDLEYSCPSVLQLQA